MKIAVAGDSAGVELAHTLAEHLKGKHEVADLSSPENDAEKF
jgi:ribose 5-phosphate isomerase B